jgi:WD40 repeat protein
MLDSNNSLVWSLVWSPDGKLLAGGCDDGKLRLWNPEGKLVATLNVESAKTIWSVAWSPDSQWVATGSDDSSIQIWEITK